VKAVLRRKNFLGDNTIKLNNLILNFDKHTVTVNLLPLILNRKEFDILSFFLANQDRLVSRTSLASHVWGDNTDEAASLEFIYSQIKNLRKKLKDASAEIEIQAVYGIGYKLISTL
jgi:DNA-binding response OmpR family regulator